MSQSHAALGETLDRIRRLAAEGGKSLHDVVDAEALADAIALPIGIVEALLNGETLPPDDIEQRVCQRVHALYLARIARTGKRPTDVRREIEAHLGRSHEWVRLLCYGRKVPNVGDLHKLREFFGVCDSFHFTDPASQALNKALQPYLRQLEAANGSVLATLLRDFNAASLAYRGQVMNLREEAIVTTVFTALMSPGDLLADAVNANGPGPVTGAATG
ncbi:hypothetical protein SAM9427_37150 (plasmid) [Streptomyces sp. ETH9427]|uniref:hypothetical protein n=1 Tax=Streptomyces sp. E1N211 TaxID=1851876 RepID=UPI000E0B60E9|nr:hypothetical protein [Streptomyces sp. E1N211]AXI91397.1 hypothetical protein SAM9427_37150 [Streptomyces sp. ETH9427]